MEDGHGHVRPRADGARAKCGGPARCATCQGEKAYYELEATEGDIPIGTFKYNGGGNVNSISQPSAMVPAELNAATRLLRSSE
jgi:hypothetical protein